MANGRCNEPFSCTLVPTYVIQSTESYQKWSPVPVIAPQKIHMGEKNKSKNKGGREGGKREAKKSMDIYTCVGVCWRGKGPGRNNRRIMSKKTFEEVVRNLHYY